VARFINSCQAIAGSLDCWILRSLDGWMVGWLDGWSPLRSRKIAANT